MGGLIQKICVTVLLLSLTGCAYVEYLRVYDIRPELAASQRLAVNDVLEHYFLDKGFILKQKYRDYYPVAQYVTVMGIHGKPEDKREEPTLTISVNSTGLVKISYSIYFLQTFTATPDDILAASADEIINKVKSITGVAIELNLSKRSYD